MLLGVFAVHRALVLVFAAVDVVGVEEPNVVVLILEELCFHLQDLDTAHFGDIVAVLHALLVGIAVVFLVKQKVVVARHALVVIVDLLIWLVFIHRGVEQDSDGYPASKLGFYASLDDFDLLPLIIVRPLLQDLHESTVFIHEYSLDAILVLLVPEDRSVLILVVLLAVLESCHGYNPSAHLFSGLIN